LQKMSVEDAQWRQPSLLAQLPVSDRVQALIFQLRDCDAVQDSQPGNCWIPGFYQLWEMVPPNAADQLIAEGFDAVPSLIEALEDSRLTRSYGFYRDFAPWRYVLEVRDAAIQSLVVLADDLSDRRLYHNNTSSGYLSNDKREARAAAIDRVNKWWAEAQAMGEAEWLRSRLRSPGQSRPMLLRRLVQVERERAVPDVRKWLAEEKHNRTYAYQLLLRAGGSTVISEVKAIAVPASMEFDFAALFAVKKEGHVPLAEYTAALFKGAKSVAERDAGKLPGQVLTALAETGDRECSLLLAERLRAGKSIFDDNEMMRAFGKIDDPQIGSEVAAYLLPFFDVSDIGKASGWRQHYEGKPDLYRIKDNAAFSVNRLLGHPLPAFHDLTPPQRDAEIEKLRRICDNRGIQPAFGL
jgi:hypothetical protein